MLVEVNELECVVGGVLALVLRVSRWAGVAPLRVRARTSCGWPVAVSPTLAVLQSILMTVFNTVVLAALILDFREDPDRRICGKAAGAAFVWIVDLVLVMAIANLAAYCGSARMENLIRILKQLQKINIDLNNDSCTKTERLGIFIVACMLIYAEVIATAEAWMKIDFYKAAGLNWLIMAMYSVYYAAGITGLLALMQWGFTAAKVHAAAAALNHQLRRLIHGSEFIDDPLCVQYTIRHLALSHEQIGEVIKQMTAGNGVFIMAVLMSVFLRLVDTPYYLVLGINSDERVWETVFTHVAFSILHIVALLLTIEPCHWTQEQRETTKYLLIRLKVRLAPRSALLSRELDQFVKQATLTDVTFAPLGIHTLGRPYMAVMFGSIMSYLAILLQFQNIAPASHH